MEEAGRRVKGDRGEWSGEGGEVRGREDKGTKEGIV